MITVHLLDTFPKDGDGKIAKDETVFGLSVGIGLVLHQSEKVHLPAPSQNTAHFQPKKYCKKSGIPLHTISMD